MLVSASTLLKDTGEVIGTLRHTKAVERHPAEQVLPPLTFAMADAMAVEAVFGHKSLLSLPRGEHQSGCCGRGDKDLQIYWSAHSAQP
jgi:hypothetical protein